MLWIFAVLGIAFPKLPAAELQGDIRFRVEGIVRCQYSIPGQETFELSHGYTVEFLRCRFRIEHRGPFHNAPHLVAREFLFDGTTSYQVDRGDPDFLVTRMNIFEKGKRKDVELDRPVKLKAPTNVAVNDCPQPFMRDDPSSVLWLAFAGQCSYQESGESVELPRFPFYHEKAQAKHPVKWRASIEAPHFLESWIDFDKPSLPNSRYQVLTWTNVNGLRFPAAARFEHYIQTGDGVVTNIICTVEAEKIVLHTDDNSLARGFKSPGPAMVGDWRKAVVGQGQAYYYFSESGAVLPPHEVKGLPDFGRVMATRQANAQMGLRQRILLYFCFFAVAALPIAAVIHHNNRRTTKRKEKQ